MAEKVGCEVRLRHEIMRRHVASNGGDPEGGEEVSPVPSLFLA
ncbi:hypothetical protein [Thermocladium modestius]|nr:hypothetical protein [Thermocladium modestius]